MSPHTSYSISDLQIEDPKDSTYNGDLMNGNSIYTITTKANGYKTSASNGRTNGNPARPLVPGVYAPTIAFFDDKTEDLDIPTIKRHAVRLAFAGLHGLVTQGSNGEAVHLSRTERKAVTAATREALDEAGYNDIPVIVGCGAQSIRETIELCQEAQVSGGDYAMILPPSYYAALYTSESQFEFFTRVADASPIPILIYNYPGAVSGIDMTSDVISNLAKHQNIVGVKLTCGNTGKLGRVASKAPEGFLTMGGSCDFTLPTLIGGGKGVIGGLANIAPMASVETYNLYMAGKVKKAVKMQAILARGDWVTIKTGVVGTKSCLMYKFGYGGYGRRPLPRPTKEQALAYYKEMEELLLLEEFLVTGKKETGVHLSRKTEYPGLVELEKSLV